MGAKNNPPGSGVASALLSEAGGVSGEGSPPVGIGSSPLAHPRLARAQGGEAHPPEQDRQ